MVNVEDVVVLATTNQQAHAAQVAVPDGELRRQVKAVAELTFGSFVLVTRGVSLGRASSYLAAIGDSILGDRTFDDESVRGIREARERR